MVAREDGSIEIYSFTEKIQAQCEYECKEQDEQITGLAVGFVTSAKHPELIYSCYSGAVKSICERKASKKVGVAVDDNAVVEQDDGLEDVQQTPIVQEKKQKLTKINEL